MNRRDATKDFSRRGFLKGATGSATAMMIIDKTESQSGQTVNRGLPDTPANYISDVPDFQIPRRPMGKTGLQVSILGMGGFHLGTVAGQTEVNNMVAKAMAHGMNFFDNAWEYHKGMNEERLGTALKGMRAQAIVMTKVCTHGRKKDVAMQMLEVSLVRLRRTTSMCGRSTKSFTTTIRKNATPPTACSKRLPLQNNKARSVSSASPATRTRRSISKC
jgi:hypothetical protein